MAERILSLYASYAYTDDYWRHNEQEHREVRSEIAATAAKASGVAHLYDVFPARHDSDILIWSSWEADDPTALEGAFGGYSKAFAPLRRFIKPVQMLWGFTRPSTYSRGKSEQDMDPFEGERSPYLVAYPFAKTKEWYLMSMDARQGQMNEHIKIGKQFFDIKQLLIYSFGLQDYEFVVGYEANDLARFSELVQQLRSTEGRRHTLFDSPLVTGVHRSAEAFAS